MFRALRLRRPRLVALAMAAVAAVVATVLAIGGAFAASVSSAVFSGGTGTVGGAGAPLYAKKGGNLTLTVSTSSDTRCVQITGAHVARSTSQAAKSTWTFAFTAADGNGVQTVTAAASPGFNANNCTGQSQNPALASYTLDNAGPTVAETLNPKPNAAGWNNTNLGITWSASDAGSGVASGPTPASDSQTSATAGVEKTATATDRLGNTGSGKTSIKLDKTIPSIDATRAPAANTAGWNNSNVTVSFGCSDDLSGIKSCTGGGSVTLTDEGAGQTVPGEAVDNADNTNAAGVTDINIDKTAPALSGAPLGQPSGTDPQGVQWYKGEVAIDWTASDGLSGLASAEPADGKVATEGKGVFATASVSDRAGNTTNADSAKVNIDATAPNTNATAPTGWTNTKQMVTLVPNDALSGVKATHYSINGGAERTGTSVEIASDGVHTLEYWSVDHAGNPEKRKSVQVKIDGTTPKISHTLSPVANDNGWNSSSVTVKFVCSDVTSGIASCTSEQVVSSEGRDQLVEGTAVDNAGNQAKDPAAVSIDRTAPTVRASADRAPNGAGWYDADVTVSFAGEDALSGIARLSPAAELTEGANQSARGSATDAAGNSASDEVSGINIDKTAPLLSGSAASAANAAGWYNGDVTIEWKASDALSGLAGVAPANSPIKGEGDNLTVGASVSDKAGNTRNATSAPVKIDRSAPSTSANVPEPLASGWYAGDVKVTLTGIDSLSGVKDTYYSVDGGEPQVYGGPFVHALKGAHTITFWSTDNAGNEERMAAAGQTITLKIDGTPPTITGKRFPAANDFGWVNTDVDVLFECSDAESGLQSGVAGCDPGTKLVNEGTDLSYTGSALDIAGNKSSATVRDIKIDKTPPTLAGVAAAANAAGWHRGDVTVAWKGHDGLSGIDPATQPADTTVAGEGNNLAAGPVTIRDKAGNVSAPASVTGIKIDRTAPVISGGATTRPNAAGWYSAGVTVAFSCTDTLSGCEANGAMSSKALLGDGAGQSVTSDAAEDLAGNRASGKTVGDINIDGQAPQTSADNKCDGANGWCKGQTATVILTAADQTELSGVKEIRYSINGNPEQTAAGASATIQVPLAAKSGIANVKYYAIDNAGNAEQITGVALKYDNIAPSMTHALNPAANANDWNDDDSVVVHFEATDDDGGSGVDGASITPDVTVAAETPATGTVIKGSALDFAGNLGSDAATVKLDKTAPNITGAIVAGTKGAGDWYTGPVTVRFTCSDALSGIVACPADEVITANGRGLSASGTVNDKAGNSASVTVDGINIDSNKPAPTITGIKAGGVYTLDDVPAASCSASDNLTTTLACGVTVIGGKSNGVGAFTYTATATDAAGNTGSLTGTYRVIYKWDGFRQPINDTAHQIGTATSTFKAGSTVPAKLQLKKADGSVVQATSDPVWLTPSKGGPTSASVDETLYSESATAGGVYRWDATGSQYIYNWGTTKANANYYWRVGVSLDDGQFYYVNIGLR